MLKALLTSGSAAVLTAAGCAYAAMAPGSQLFGRTLVAGSDSTELALTYDDGPNDAETMRLLELLAKHRARATFFLIGQFARQRPEIARAVAEAGHLVGNHSMTHPALAVRAAAQVRQELADCNHAIEDAVGQPVRFFRPPFGARRPYVLRAARELGLVPVMWNAMGYDWQPISAEKIFSNVQEGIERNRRGGCGSNILLHDGGHAALGADRMQTVRATEMLLEKHSAARFVTVDAWSGGARSFPA